MPAGRADKSSTFKGRGTMPQDADLSRRLPRGHRGIWSERCVWGSGFPCELRGPKISYAQHLKIFTHELGLDNATQKAILGETAHRLWFQ